MLDGDIAIIWSRSFKEVGPVSCKLHNPPPLVIFFGANLCPTKKFKVTTLNPTVIVLIEAQAPFVGPVAPFYKELFIITQRDPEGTNHEFQWYRWFFWVQLAVQGMKKNKLYGFLKLMQERLEKS